MVRNIIFDFDGVISESVGVKADGFAMIYKEYGTNIVDKVLNHHYANGGVSRYEKFRYYHNTFLKSKLSDEELERLSKIFSKYVVKRIINAPYVDGAFNFLEDNFKRLTFFISTGTPQEEINIITTEKKINHFFKEIFGTPRNKVEHIKTILKNYKINKNNTIFIGDSIVDKEAANKMDIQFIARVKENDDTLKNETIKFNNFHEFNRIFESL